MHEFKIVQFFALDIPSMSTPMQAIFHTTGLVGTGAMGRGIAQMAAQAGSTVLLYDTQPGAAAAARSVLQTTWQTLV
ncbi:MAG: 3-hydroxybutyryl-CoA dehydrogenase, partial [Hydrogenophaga sp.]